MVRQLPAIRLWMQCSWRDLLLLSCGKRVLLLVAELGRESALQAAADSCDMHLCGADVHDGSGHAAQDASINGVPPAHATTVRQLHFQLHSLLGAACIQHRGTRIGPSCGLSIGSCSAQV